MSNDGGELCSRPGLGTRVANLALAGLVGWMAALSAGCLVTDSIEFEPEENLPPALSDEPGSQTPMGSMIEINRDLLEPGEITFALQVRDENRLQILKTRYELHSPDEADSLIEIGPDVGISGEPVRHFEFGIPTATIHQDYCYRLDLVVSSEFEAHPTIWDKPRIEGDIARARWWIVEEGASLQSCDLTEYQTGETTPQT
jgi:hypothetical protein